MRIRKPIYIYYMTMYTPEMYIFCPNLLRSVSPQRFIFMVFEVPGVVPVAGEFMITFFSTAKTPVTKSF